MDKLTKEQRIYLVDLLIGRMNQIKKDVADGKLTNQQEINNIISISKALA